MHQNSFTIYEATDAHADPIGALLEQCGLTTTNVLKPGSRYWLAEDNSGCLVAVAGLELGASAVLLRSVAVHPALRGQHISTWMVESVLKWTQAQGYPVVYLFSTETGSYWTHMGFCEVSVHELAAALPQAPQVLRLQRLGRLDSDKAWRKFI